MTDTTMPEYPPRAPDFWLSDDELECAVRHAAEKASDRVGAQWKLSGPKRNSATRFATWEGFCVIERNNLVTMMRTNGHMHAQQFLACLHGVTLLEDLERDTETRPTPCQQCGADTKGATFCTSCHASDDDE